MSGKPHEDKPTEPHDAPVVNDVEALRRHAERRGRLLLLVYHSAGVETASLEPGVPVIVGRCPPADVCVPSPDLSRTHARFTLGPTNRVTVEDLGSTNSTWIRGARVQTAEIGPGEEVTLGDVFVCVQSMAPVAVAAAGRRDDAFVAVVAVAPAMCDVLSTAARVAPSSVPVIISGETGTGKEVIARYLHAHGPRARKPMVSVNCAAIPVHLVESTLFGHEKGAFTGADQRRKGVFEEADGGTVFLDEIGELPLSAQAALLRVLETARFVRVGSARETAVDVRVVAATHRDLEALRDAGAFRPDLYYRLGVITLAIPALRDRVEDIEPLAWRFVAGAGGDRVRGIEADALARLRAYAWPGNVRELRNVIERAVVLTKSEWICEADLPAQVREVRPAPPRAQVAGAARGAAFLEPREAVSTPGLSELRAQLQDHESRSILETLQAVGWNQSEAARRLGIPIRTLANKVKARGLKKPPRPLT